MTIDSTHNAFRGSAFTYVNLKRLICYVCGGSYPPHDKGNAFLWEWQEAVPDPDLWYIGRTFTKDQFPGLWRFLDHVAEPGGESLTPFECCQIANDMAFVIPRLKDISEEYADIAAKFAEGCGLAAILGEQMEFH
jgi:hypothetical protein